MVSAWLSLNTLPQVLLQMTSLLGEVRRIAHDQEGGDLLRGMPAEEMVRMLAAEAAGAGGWTTCQKQSESLSRELSAQESSRIRPIFPKSKD